MLVKPLELRAQLIFLYRNQHVTFLLNHYFDPNNDDYDDQQEIGWRTTRVEMPMIITIKILTIMIMMNMMMMIMTLIMIRKMIRKKL